MFKPHEVKSTLVIALPLIAAFLAQKGMQFIDTMMMGWLGPYALAAGAIGTGIFIATIVFCMGTLSAVGVFISRAKGADDPEDIQSSLKHGLWLALFLSLPCVIVIWFVPHFLVKYQNREVVHNATLLLHGLSIGLPGYLFFLIFREFISAFSQTRAVMLVTILSLPLTFFINYILIYGKFGLPALGVSGIGYAGAIVMWFMSICLFLYSVNHSQLKKYLKFKTVEFKLIKIKDMLFIGLPSGMYFLLEAAMFLSVMLMMGHFGVDALASFQIAMQCAIIVYAIPFALSMVTALQVSHAMGAGELSRFKTIAFQNFGLGLLFSLIVTLCFILLPSPIVRIFLNSDPDHISTLKLAASFLTIAAFFQFFDTIQAIANGMLRGMKDTLVPMLSCIACYWVIGIGCSYYFSFYTGFGPKGIWLGITSGICSLGIVLMIRLVNKLNGYHNHFHRIR